MAGALLGTLAGLCVLYYGVRADFDRYAVVTVGVFHRVRRRSVREAGHLCRDCQGDIEVGERRRYYKALVVGGSELLRYGGGEARYCYDHADVGVRDGLEPVETFADHPAWLAALITAIDAVGGLGERSSVPESEFDAVAGDVGDAMQLAPLAVAVVLAVVVISVLKAIRPGGA